MKPAKAAPRSGASQNSHTWPAAAPGAKIAVAVERAGFTEPPVIGSAAGQVWLFWLAPLLGAAFAGFIYKAFPAPAGTSFTVMIEDVVDDSELDDSELDDSEAFDTEGEA